MPQLISLDNQVTFKRSFSDKLVLETFVEDVIGQPFEAGLIETEKEFDPPVGSVKVRFDIFAESADKRVILELQRVRYDSNFHRFLDYFLLSIVQQISSSKNYIAARQVFTIVMLTAPYRQVDRTGCMIEDSMLISSLDPRPYNRDRALSLFGHRLIFLNPSYPYDHLPAPLREWMHLMTLSKTQPQMRDDDDMARLVGSEREAVLQAARLSTWDGLSAEERTAYMDTQAAEMTSAFYIGELNLAKKQVTEERQRADEAVAWAKEVDARAKEVEERAKLAADKLERARLRMLAAGLDPDAD